MKTQSLVNLHTKDLLKSAPILNVSGKYQVQNSYLIEHPLTTSKNKGRERCPSCYGYFYFENKLTVASPLLIIHGEGFALNNYPLSLSFPSLNKNGLEELILKYDLSYVSLKSDETAIPHYTSFFKHKDTSWYYHEGLSFGNPLTKFFTLPTDASPTITFLVYACLTAFSINDFSKEERKRKRKQQPKNQRKNRKNNITVDVEGSLCVRERVQLYHENI